MTNSKESLIDKLQECDNIWHKEKCWLEATQVFKIIREHMGDASTRKDEGVQQTALQASPDNEPRLSELRNWVKANGRENNFSAQLEVALDRIAGLESVLNKQERPSEIRVIHNALDHALDCFRQGWEANQANAAMAERTPERTMLKVQASSIRDGISLTLYALAALDKLKTPEPVSVSLEKCAFAVAALNIIPDTVSLPMCRSAAKSVLDAAGIKYD